MIAAITNHYVHCEDVGNILGTRKSESISKATLKSIANIMARRLVGQCIRLSKIEFRDSGAEQRVEFTCLRIDASHWSE